MVPWQNDDGFYFPSLLSGLMTSPAPEQGALGSQV